MDVDCSRFYPVQTFLQYLGFSLEVFHVKDANFPTLVLLKKCFVLLLLQKRLEIQVLGISDVKIK